VFIVFFKPISKNVVLCIMAWEATEIRKRTRDTYLWLVYPPARLRVQERQFVGPPILQSLEIKHP